MKFDRRNAGNGAFDPQFAAIHTALLEPIDGMIKLRIIVDKCSVEIFANDGLVVMTEQIFPDDVATGIKLLSPDGDFSIRNLTFSTIGNDSTLN